MVHSCCRAQRLDARRWMAGVSVRIAAVLRQTLFTLPVLLTGLPSLHSAEAGGVQFVDVAAEAGIGFRHANSATSLKYLIETVSGGVGFLDYDNDGWLDVFVANAAISSANGLFSMRFSQPLRTTATTV